jgi:hypothetical protein
MYKRVLVRKLAGSRPTGRISYKWENTKMDLGEIAWDSLDKINLV